MSGPRALVITGDPGMGKTRLLNECVERVTLAGGVVAVGRPLETDHDAPWSTLRLLMRSELASAPGVAGADPHALSVLAALVPELAERFQPVEPRDTSYVAAALASLLGSVSEERPVAIAIDDAHFADGSTIGALGAAVRQLASEPVILIVAADRSAEDAPRDLVRLRGEIGRQLPGVSVRLDPLTGDEMRQLIAALAPWCDTADDLDRLTRRMVLEAGGSPFLAVTLLHELERTATLKDDLLKWPTPQATLDSPLPFTIPDLVRMAIVARVKELDEQSRSVLRVASIGGIVLDVDLISALAEIPAKTVEQLLDQLERHRFVVYDGHRYAFTAQLIAQVVRGEYLTPGQRQRLRKQAVTELVARDDLTSKLLRAELLAQIGTGDEAFAEALQAVEAAIAVGADRAARRALLAAERVAGDDGETKQSLVEEYRLRIER